MTESNNARLRVAAYLPGLVLAAAVLLVAAGFALYVQLAPHAPQRACRFISPPGAPDLWTVCGDSLDESLGDGQMVFVGNVTIAPNEDPPILRVGNMGSSAFGVSSLAWTDVPALGRRTAILRGDVYWEMMFQDTGDWLTSSGIKQDVQTGEYINVSDFLEWNVVTGKIANTVPELHDHLDGPLNSGFDLFWADVSGMNTNFWGEDLTNTAQLSMTFDLYARRFTATMPITFSVNGNPADDVGLGLRVVFTEGGFLTGGLSDFSPKVGPVTFDLKDVVVRPGEFEAGIVEAMADKNPDLAMLADPVPPKAGLLFGLTGLKFKNRQWSINGGEVQIRNLTLGEAVNLTQNRIGIQYEGGDALLRLRSTINFGDYLTSTAPLTTEMRIGVVSTTVNSQTVLKPFFDGGIAAFTGNMGPVKFGLTNIKLQGDPANNFYGLNAANVTMQWGSIFGGQSKGGLSGMKLGIDKTKKLKFELNGGSVQSPPISTGVFSGTQLLGNVGVVSNTVNLTFTGNIVIKLPGGAKDGSNNSVNPAVSLVIRAGKSVRQDCNIANAPTPCFKRIDGSLTAFSIKLAGFKIALANVRPGGDGGIEVGTATLSVPAVFGGGGAGGGLSTGISGFKLLGNGDVSITGGSITLPPLKVAGMTFGGFTGGFATEMVTVNNQQVKAYRFTGGATLTLPGLEPTANKSIAVSATVVAIPSTNEVDEVDATLTFQSHPGIPIAASGVELTEFNGNVHLKTGAITFTVGIGVDSQAHIPPTGVGLPIVSLNGTALVRPDPFFMSLGAQLKILIFNVASAQMEIGEGAGFHSCPPGTPSSTPASQCPRGRGFHASFNVDALFIHGTGDVRVGKVNSVRKFQGSATLNFGLEKGQFGFGLPRKDRILTGISFAAGEFNVPGTSVNTAGMKGTFEILGFDYSMFINFNKSVGANNWVVLGGNLDDYQLVNTAAMASALARGDAGFGQSSMTLSRGDGSLAVQTTITAPYVVSVTQPTYFGIHYTGTVAITPSVRLLGPGMRIQITAASHNSSTIFYDVDTSPVLTKGNDVGILLTTPNTGTWQMAVDNAPADYQLVLYRGNKKPEIEHKKTGQTTSLGQLVKTTLTWVMTDTDSPNAVVTANYARVNTNTNEVALSALVPVFTTTQQGTYSATWQMDGKVPSGVYRWVLVADDSKNAPVMYVDGVNLTVVDTQAPATPTGLNGLPLPRRIQAAWNPNAEADLAGYEIGFGPSNNPATFIYSRTMGSKEILSDTFGLQRTSPSSVDATLVVTQFDGMMWGLQDGQTVFFGVRAYDESGNFSPWAISNGAPWGLSPQSASPAPGSVGPASPIEVAFDSPLAKAGLTNLLQVRNGANQVVTGTVSILYGFDPGTAIGLRFTPSNPMPAGPYTARLTGKAGGVTTLDNRTMPDDFVWSFTFTSTLLPPPPIYPVYLPTTLL